MKTVFMAQCLSFLFFRFGDVHSMGQESRYHTAKLFLYYDYSNSWGSQSLSQMLRAWSI